MAEEQKEENPKALSECINLNDFEKLAQKKLATNAFSYFISFANHGETYRRNFEIFSQVLLNSRILKGVSEIDMKTTILGNHVDMPICLAPTAMQRIAHPEGECAVARAATKRNIIQTVSTLSTSSFEEIDEASPKGLRWFQYYIRKDRETSFKMVRLAEKFGYKAIVLTVDTPVLGKREASMRYHFHLPPPFQLKIYGATMTEIQLKKESNDSLLDLFHNDVDAGLCWEDVKELQRITRLPIVLKGVQTPEDALIARDMGVRAIWVSNHGGRQLDTVESTLEMLVKISRALEGSGIEIYLDGGIRRGTDVLKALALGARCIFIGRPVLWGLASGGELGVLKMLDMLKDEFKMAMQLSGVRSLAEINRNCIANPAVWPKARI